MYQYNYADVAGGKSFQAAIFQAHKTPRPRRALGSVNEVHRVGGRATVPHHVKNSSGGSVSVNTQKPNKVTEKDFKLKQQQLDVGCFWLADLKDIDKDEWFMSVYWHNIAH